MVFSAELLHTLTDKASMVTVFLYGTSKCLPLYFPVIIRIVSFLGGDMELRSYME